MRSSNNDQQELPDESKTLLGYKVALGESGRFYKIGQVIFTVKQL
jgi:hypothetical protein